MTHEQSNTYESLWPHSNGGLVSLCLLMTSSERDGHFHAKSVSGGMAPVNGICESIRREKRGGILIYLKVGRA